MPSVRAVFLFSSIGYNVHTSISPVERRYTLFECSNVKLYYRQEKASRANLRAFIVYTAICRRSMQPRKRCRRAPAAFRRLFIRPSGRGCLRLSLRLLRSFRPSACSICCVWSAGPAARSGSARSAGQAGARPARVVSSLSLLSSFLCQCPSVRFSLPVQESPAGKS